MFDFCLNCHQRPLQTDVFVIYSNCFCQRVDFLVSTAFCNSAHTPTLELPKILNLFQHFSFHFDSWLPVCTSTFLFAHLTAPYQIKSVASPPFHHQTTPPFSRLHFLQPLSSTSLPHPTHTRQHFRSLFQALTFSFPRANHFSSRRT